MKALSVRQPHADRIALGLKTIEMRSKPTHHRGPLLICVSSQPRIEGRPHGVALCLVNVADCRPLRKDDEHSTGVPYAPNHYAWVIDKVVPLESIGIKPFPVKGALGFYNVDLDLRKTT